MHSKVVVSKHSYIGWRGHMSFVVSWLKLQLFSEYITGIVCKTFASEISVKEVCHHFIDVCFLIMEM